MGDRMNKNAFMVLDVFNNNGFLAYIVGGYVRDYLLDKKTLDIDICTSATPKDIIKLFDQTTVSKFSYGSVTIVYNSTKFDITTFRKDIKYEDNRKPIKIKYIDSLKKDLLRRDFTINTICMDSKGNIIDLLDGKKDLDNKLIRCVGSSRIKFKEDSLRILRAIRFATILDFDIEGNTLKYLKRYGYLLANLSNNRKKDELTKIFSSVNKEKGRELLISNGLDKYLGINNLKDIVLCDDIIGIWAQLETEGYPFNKLEKDNINKIREILCYKDIDLYTLYKYGLYLCSVVYDIRGLDKAILNEMYRNMPIYSKKDIDIDTNMICNVFDMKPDRYVKDVYEELEKKIVYGNINNNRNDILEYIIENKDKFI